MTSPARLLILGGTAEAAALAEAAVARFGAALDVTTSLAGRTGRPARVAGALRIGGFGGAAGLARYLRRQRVDLLIDATHPFAARMSANARDAADTTGVPCLTLRRPEWQRDPADRWIEVDDVADAAAQIAQLGRRVLLTIGRTGLEAFAAVRDVHFVVRTIDPPADPIPLRDYELVCARGPFSVEAERALMRQHAIEVVVAKASGGSATQAKLVAARELGLPVVLLRRPPAPSGEQVASVAEALAWLAARLAA